MKFTLASVAFFASSALAHTWLDCVDTEILNEDEARNPSIRAQPQYKCHAYPRNKLYDGDWIVESSKYSYGFATAKDKKSQPACRPDIQGNPGEEAPGKPMLHAKPGQTVQMRFWGNGHSDYWHGSPRNADPGIVRVYWPGEPGKQIEKIGDLTEKYWIPGAQGNFSDNAITWTDVTPMKEPGNFLKFTIPEKIQNGVHHMVFTWANAPGFNERTACDPKVYNKYWQNSFSTCFDVKVDGSDYNEAKSDVVKANQEGYDERKEEDDYLAALCSGPCSPGGFGEPCEGDSCAVCRVPGGSIPACYTPEGDGTCPFAGEDCSGYLKQKRHLLARSHARKHRRALRV